MLKSSKPESKKKVATKEVEKTSVDEQGNKVITLPSSDAFAKFREQMRQLREEMAQEMGVEVEELDKSLKAAEKLAKQQAALEAEKNLTVAQRANRAAGRINRIYNQEKKGKINETEAVVLLKNEALKLMELFQ